MDYKKLYEQNQEKIAELEKENEQLKNKNKEQQLIIDCHLAELEFTEASALDVAMEFNDWLKSKYCEDEEKYKQMYDCFNLDEYLQDEEDEDQ